MKAIITGATGMVGKGVLLECLDHNDIDEVLVIGRSSLEIDHPKLRELIHSDFSDFEPVKDQLQGYQACYLCMGISAAGLSEEAYAKVTYTYTLALAKAVVEANQKVTCTYVSGEGTDSSEKGRTMWARVKGKTENDLLKLGFDQAFMLRPGAIIPLRGIKSKTKLYQFMYDYFLWLIKLAKRMFPNAIVNTTQMGLSMIHITQNGYTKNVLHPKDIVLTAQ